MCLNARVDGTLNAVFPLGNDTSLPGGSSHIFRLILILSWAMTRTCTLVGPFSAELQSKWHESTNQPGYGDEIWLERGTSDCFRRSPSGGTDSSYTTTIQHSWHLGKTLRHKLLENLNPYDVFPNSGSMRKISVDSLGGAGRSVCPVSSPCSMGSANQMVGVGRSFLPQIV
jgi:hypothetical protein